MDLARARLGIAAWERAEAQSLLQELVPGAARAGPERAPPDLFSRASAAALVEAWRAAGHGVGGSQARRLAARVARGCAGARLDPLRARVAARERGLRVRVGDLELGFPDLAGHILAMPDRHAREALAEAQARALEEHLNPAYGELAGALRDGARELGFPDHAARCDALHDLGLEGLEAELDPLLRRTETLYRWHAEGLLGRSVQGALAMSGWQDLARAVAVPWFDDAFPGPGMRPEVEGLLQGLGLAAPGLRIHEVPTPPGWPAGALTLEEEPPGAVHLALRRGPGIVAWRAALHEAAHAAHGAATLLGLGVEDARLGDPAVREAFGILFEGIVAEPAWAARHLREDHRELHAWQQRVLRLLAVRRAAGLLRAELVVHREGLAKAPQAYRRAMERALVVAHAPQRALLEVLADGDEAFDAAATLRAHALAAALRGALRARFGAAWWEQRAAGDWLRGLWARGQAWEADALTEHLGAKTGLEPLVADLIEDLREEPHAYKAFPRF